MLKPFTNTLDHYALSWLYFKSLRNCYRCHVHYNPRRIFYSNLCLLIFCKFVFPLFLSQSSKLISAIITTVNASITPTLFHSKLKTFITFSKNPFPGADSHRTALTQTLSRTARLLNGFLLVFPLSFSLLSLLVRYV